MSEITNNIDEILKELSRPLEPSEVTWKPKQIVSGRNGEVKGLLLPYKTARIDMARLDDACGVGWQCDYKREGNSLFCGIGLLLNENNEWIWRWAAGSESEMEQVKGEASDALKRAGTMWGIGRELYYFPQVWVSLNESEYEDGERPKYSRNFPYILKTWHWEFKETEGGKPWVIGSDKAGNIRFNSNPYNSKNPKT